MKKFPSPVGVDSFRNGVMFFVFCVGVCIDFLKIKPGQPTEAFPGLPDPFTMKFGSLVMLPANHKPHQRKRNQEQGDKGIKRMRLKLSRLRDTQKAKDYSGGLSNNGGNLFALLLVVASLVRIFLVDSDQ